jgi:hypothetical protein
MDKVHNTQLQGCKPCRAGSSMTAILGVPPKSCVLWTGSTFTILTQTNIKIIFFKKANIQMDKVHNTQLQGYKPCRAALVKRQLLYLYKK